MRPDAVNIRAVEKAHDDRVSVQRLQLFGQDFIDRLFRRFVNDEQTTVVLILVRSRAVERLQERQAVRPAPAEINLAAASFGFCFR
jgi:hypothetical protein